jgi:hypothetical protein
VKSGRELGAVMVRYADDFVVLCRKGRLYFSETARLSVKFCFYLKSPCLMG